MIRSSMRRSAVLLLALFFRKEATGFSPPSSSSRAGSSRRLFFTGGPVSSMNNPQGKRLGYYDNRKLLPIFDNRLLSTTRLYQQLFDITKPVFDLYSFRSIRGDALTKYNSLNQSEPLRINLFALLVLTFLSIPVLAQDLYGESLTLPQTAGSVLAAVASGALFVRECQRRSRQLTRLEKELQALNLKLRLPTNALADAPFTRTGASIRSLQQRQAATAGLRVLCLSGTTPQLKSCLQQLAVFGRRFTQANTVVVAVPMTTETSPISLLPESLQSTRPTWLAAPDAIQAWRAYFKQLGHEEEKEFKWFGLSATGRSFGSGQGREPSWLQLLGQHLRPAVLLEQDDKSQADVEGVLARQAQFYEALTQTGTPQDMTAIFSANLAEDVSAVVEEGGRLDDWASCLAPGARPKGMTIANADVTLLSDSQAFSTAIEFPVTAGIVDATLLAVQEWTRTGGDDEWRLVQHQTIPWTDLSAAGGTLICDCRGCVSLVRSPSGARTRGGVIG